MLVWLTLPFYDFCGFRSVAVNSVYKLQFFTFIRVNTAIIATADLAHFINVALKNVGKITSWARYGKIAEIETRLWCVSRPRPHPRWPAYAKSTVTALNDVIMRLRDWLWSVL